MSAIGTSDFPHQENLPVCCKHSGYSSNHQTNVRNQDILNFHKQKLCQWPRYGINKKKKITSSAENFKEVEVIHANTMRRPRHIMATTTRWSCNRERMRKYLNLSLKTGDCVGAQSIRFLAVWALLMVREHVCITRSLWQSNRSSRLAFKRGPLSSLLVRSSKKSLEYFVFRDLGFLI